MKSFDSQSRLIGIVKGLKKHKNRYIILKGSIIIAISFLVAFGMATMLSLISSNPYYFAALKILIILSILYALYKLAIIPITDRKVSNSFLDKLDSLSPGLREDTLNAVQLRDDLKESRNLGTSENLAHAHISETTLKLESFDLSAIYRLGELRKFLLPLFGSLIFTAAAIFLSPDGFTRYFFSLSLAPEKTGDYLELADIEITLRYPEYTKLEPGKLDGGSTDVKTVKGTVVQFEAKPLHSFNEGALMVENSVSVPVEREDGRIKAEFTILSSGSFVITETSKGLSSRPYNIIAEEDKKPEVKIYSPAGNTVELGSEEKIDIFYEAEDDFEISRILLNWENQRNQSDVPIQTDGEQINKIDGRILWGPSGINPEDGDTIKLRVLAYDNDTISGPKPGMSNVITVKLKDGRSKHRETLNFAGQLMEELLDILGDEINLSAREENFESGGDSEQSVRVLDEKEILKKQKNLTLKIEHATNTLDTTISSMSEDEYSDYTFFVGLTNMDLRLNGLLDERKYLIESSAKPDLVKIDGLMEREIPEFEGDILLLDSLLQGDKLMDSLRSGNELLSEYKELSELLSQLKDGGNEEITGQIQEKLDQIRDLMSQLAKKMENLGGEIQEGFLNQDAFKAQNMQKQLDQISKLAQEGNIEEALSMLESMSQGLQNMIASLENGMQSFGSSMMAKEMSKLNELVSRISNIEKQESSLKDSTEGLKNSLLEDPDLPGENLREFVESELTKTKEITRNLKEGLARISGSSPDGGNPEGAYLMEKMIEKTEQLNNWLKAMDFNEAANNAKSVEETTLGLKEMSNINFGGLGKASEEIGNASRIAREVSRDLKQFSEIGGGGRQFTERAERQDEIEGQTGELNNDLSELGSGFFVAPGLGEKLEQAEDFMGNASQDLRSRLVSKAISNQEEALKSLREAKQQAQDMLGQMKMSAGGNGSSAPMMLGQRPSGQSPQGVENRYVEIPAVDESQIGKEFKQKILEAMKAGSPEGYSELNKKYYDRIIK